MNDLEFKKDSNSVATTDFIPYKVFHPGIILRKEFMEGMDIMELSRLSGLKIKEIKPVIKCKARVTPRIAVGLAKAFHTSPQFWLNLQTSYVDWCIRKLLKKTKKEGHFDKITIMHGSNVGKSMSAKDMILCFPRQVGKSLMMDRLKDRDVQLALGHDPDPQTKRISSDAQDAICLAPRYYQDADGTISGPITFNQVNPES